MRARVRSAVADSARRWDGRCKSRLNSRLAAQFVIVKDADGSVTNVRFAVEPHSAACVAAAADVRNPMERKIHMSSFLVPYSCEVNPMFSRHSKTKGASALLAGALILAVASVSNAQTTVIIGDPEPPRAPVFELRPYAGTYIPTGAQDNFLSNSLHVGAQAALYMTPTFALVGNFGWSPTQDEVGVVEQDLNLFNYDLGFEARASRMEWGDNFTFQPFIGVGAGGRTYNYSDTDAIDSRSFWHGYGAVGGELAFRRVGIRVEARDYVSEFRPLVGGTLGSTELRNDVTVAAGISLRIY